jgi:hypothetical protein
MAYYRATIELAIPEDAPGRRAGLRITAELPARMVAGDTEAAAKQDALNELATLNLRELIADRFGTELDVSVAYDHV